MAWCMFVNNVPFSVIGVALIWKDDPTGDRPHLDYGTIRLSLDGKMTPPCSQRNCQLRCVWLRSQGMYVINRLYVCFDIVISHILMKLIG